MNRALVGEPSVSAFWRSVDRNLGGHISRMKRFSLSNYSLDYFDPKEYLIKLKKKLTFVRDLLVDGEARRLGEESVDEWMDDFKHLLYDVEDILDDMKSLNNDQVHQLYKTSHELKQRLEDILARTEELQVTAKDLDLKRYAFSGESKVTLRTPETSSEVDISEIHGREDDEAQIVKRLLEVDAKPKKNYDVLCIVGMGGLGKTTLAQLVFNNPEVVKHFEVKGWVCISNIFDVARATKDLIQCSGNGGSLGDQPSLAVLQRRLTNMVVNKRFLFVLDDVWSSSEWEKMKAPFISCANGSNVLVTTRNIQIAHALGNQDPYQLQGLNHEKCMAIFRDKAFVDDEDDHEKLIFGEKIVEACGGAPLIVKVIGSMLQKAGVEKWRAVSENTVSWATEKDEIHPAIRFSYYDLPASIKRCFEYLAVFPPDFKFKEDDVVRLWIADGLVEDVKGRMAEDIGAEYFNELKARSLIQKNNMMHDIVHHFASVVSRKFCYEENSKEPLASLRHAFVVELNAMHYDFLAQAPGLRTLIVECPQDENVLGDTIRSCKMLRTLEICDEWEASLCVDHLTHLRYLTIKRSNVELLPDFLCMLDNLQFLNLEGDGYENFLERISHLSNLRYSTFHAIASLPESMIRAHSQLQVLEITTNFTLEQLPKNIGNLRSLRLLNLRETSISSLPESICALSQLQVLDLEDCTKLKELPKEMGNLMSLQELNLKATFISILPDSISALGQLQGLKLSHCESFEQLPKDIGNLKSLRTLDLRETSISSLPESICTLTQLQDLDLSGCKNLIELPKDIGNVRSLRELHLKRTFISSLPDSICALSQLRVLDLEECSESFKQLPKDIGNLKSLRTVGLRETSISSLPESICALTQLQDLDLGGCKNLKELPKDIGNLRSLRELHLKRTFISSLPDSVCALSQLQVLDLEKCRDLKQLPRDMGNIRSLGDLKLDNISNLGVPESILNITELQNLSARFSLIGSRLHIAGLKALPVGREEGQGKVTELNLLDSLGRHNICFSNLIFLKMVGLNKICEMTDMEFVSLKYLCIEKCPILRKVLIATPNLKALKMGNCGEFITVHLLPSLSDKAGLLSIVSRLKRLNCDYNIF